MTDVEFAILIFGMIFVAFLSLFVVLMIIFKWHKKRNKTMTEKQFNERLSQNKNNCQAETIIEQDEIKKNDIMS